ncbi:hypothetical protein CORC01_10826 [Colletotrichum orchidophilum]|uniref:Uncharacterized protein n=1 Tax=Colletotrichum orchidophilum TaxID=1209926 RepID=A0A1G4AXR4_9PEZI|nr:uncharacterized protein CORC01_10826 [Colletotrichum orchidophilum]OHE93927.1 hypothetical protein CORC01_10826 [Colletotrichum orchidophilum]
MAEPPQYLDDEGYFSLDDSDARSLGSGEMLDVLVRHLEHCNLPQEGQGIFAMNVNSSGFLTADFDVCPDTEECPDVLKAKPQARELELVLRRWM